MELSDTIDAIIVKVAKYIKRDDLVKEYVQLFKKKGTESVRQLALELQMKNANELQILPAMYFCLKNEISSSTSLGNCLLLFVLNFRSF
jgi:hypothetical protein